MTGSGTAEDPYIIKTINDLQAMKDNLAAFYQLGNNIDAALTKNWNDGKGFEPVGVAATQEADSHPDSDDSSTDGWTVSPADPPTKWDKVQGGSGNISAAAADNWVLFGYPAVSLRPDAQITRVSILACLTMLPGDFFYETGISGYIRVNGNYYTVGEQLLLAFSDDRWVSLDIPYNPDTLEAWNPDNLSDIEAFGIYIEWITSGGIVRVKELKLVVQYNLFFTGNLEGSEYTISNLHINRSDQDDVGLFGYLTGNVANVNLESVSIVGAANTGALAGQMYSDASKCYSSGEVEGTTNVGGLFGIASGDFNVCRSSCKVTGNGDNVGGLAGYLDGDAEECSASGAVQVSGNWNYIGGLVGYALANLPKCYASGSVQADSCNYVGGLVGIAAGK